MVENVSMLSIFYLELGESTERIEINEIYKIEEESHKICHAAYGQWEPSNGLKLFEPSLTKRRSNFHNHRLK